jgi:AraC-like DNA-binding protein
MLDALYTQFRSASGFALMVVGVGFLVEPARQRVRMAFGTMFVCVGFLFFWSAFSEQFPLPAALDSFLLLAIVYAQSQALLEIVLFLFGGEAVVGRRRLLYIVGAIWSALLWFLPFLDSILGLPALRVSIEDGRRMAFFQTISTSAIYLWPVFIVVAAFMISRWSLSDVPRNSPALRPVLFASWGLIAVLSMIGVAMACSHRPAYRIGHLALEGLLIVWYFYIRANPDTFAKAREAIGDEYRTHHRFSDAEAADIDSRLKRFVSRRNVFADPDLDLPALAKRADLPAYRLSAYFNSRLGQSFSDWLNAVRIDYVKELLETRRDLSILAISMEAGYASKTAFNSQFLRRVGMKPSEYRAKFFASKGADSAK